MRRHTHAFVDTQAELERRCAEWRGAGRIAFDTEFIRDETYHAVLCLVQVTAGDEVTLIDPTAGLDLSCFWALAHDPDLVKVVHAGKEDFEVCVSTTGKAPRNIFDVQIAAGFVGYGYPLNLVRLVDQVLRRRIAKGETLTDWLRRPLTEDQVRYAIEDVAHLPDLHAKLSRELEKAGRAGWAREEFERFEEAALYRPPAQDRLQRVKGARKLEGGALMVLQHLVEWRDQWAQRNNRPARMLVRDDVLVELARRRPRKVEDIEVMRGFPKSRNNRVAQDVIAVIEQARNVPRQEWPKPVEIREETPLGRALIDLLSAVSRALCFEGGVSHDLLGGAARLREFVDYLEEECGAGVQHSGGLERGADRGGSSTDGAGVVAAAAKPGVGVENSRAEKPRAATESSRATATKRGAIGSARQEVVVAEKPALLSGWRAEFLGKPLLDMLEGRKQIHLSGWPKDIRLELQAAAGEVG